jgi:Spy/CpxP family protein refolding chaperone
MEGRIHMRRKPALLVLAIGMVALTLMAQDQQQPSTTTPAPGADAGKMHRRHPGPGNIDGRLAMLSRRFDLTEAQKQQVRPLLQDAIQQARSLHQDASLTPDQKMAKMRELHQGLRGKIEAILTPEQRAMKGVKRYGPRGRWQAAMDPQRRLAILDRRVKLTDDQKAKLLPIFEQEKQQLQAEAAKMREIHRATQQQVSSVLTPEQQQLQPAPPQSSK